MQNQEQNREYVWNAIASSWSNLRQKPLDFCIKFSKEWKPGKILDIGCGNCRNLMPFERWEFECYGIDFSENMLEEAKKYIKKHKLNVKLKKAHATELPFKEEFDYCLCLRTLPLIKQEDREKAINEIKRILKARGRLLVSIWNKAYPKYWFKPKNYTALWHTKDKVFQREYHMFSPIEIKNLLKKHGFKILKTSFFFSQEYWILAQKI